MPLYHETIAANAELVASVNSLEDSDPSCPQVSIRSVCDVDLDAMPDHLKIVWDANAASLTGPEEFLL